MDAFDTITRRDHACANGQTDFICDDFSRTRMHWGYVVAMSILARQIIIFRLVVLAAGGASLTSACAVEERDPQIVLASITASTAIPTIHRFLSDSVPSSAVDWLATVEAELPAYSDSSVGLLAVTSDGFGLAQWENAESLSTVGAMRRLGRKGSGPGEIQYVGWVGACSSGESVLFDPVRLRVLQMSYLKATVTEVPAPYLTRQGSVIGCLAATRLLALLTPPMITTERHGLNRRLTSLVLLDSSGIADTLVVMPGREWWFDAESNWMPNLTWRDETLAAHARDRVLLIQAATGEALLIDLTRRVAERHSFEHECASTGDRLLESAVEANLSIARSLQDRQELREALTRASTAAPVTRRFWGVVAGARDAHEYVITGCHDDSTHVVFEWTVGSGESQIRTLGRIPVEARVIGGMPDGELLVARPQADGLQFGILR